VLRLFDGRSGEDLGEVSAGAGITALDVDDDGRTIAVGCVDGSVRSYDLTRARWLGRWGGDRRVAVTAIALPGAGAAGLSVVTADAHGGVTCWRSDGGFLLGRHEGAVTGLAFGPDEGNVISTGRHDGLVRVWAIDVEDEEWER
jgi:pre-mRNA-processing factor 19